MIPRGTARHGIAKGSTRHSSVIQLLEAPRPPARADISLTALRAPCHSFSPRAEPQPEARVRRLGRASIPFKTPTLSLSHLHPATFDLHNPHSETCICEVSALCAISCFPHVLVSFLSKVPAHGAGSLPVCCCFALCQPQDTPKLNSLEQPSHRHNTHRHGMKLTTAMALIALRPPVETAVHLMARIPRTTLTTVL